MTVEPWSPQKIPNIADTRSAFVRRRQRRRMERTAQSTVLAVTILSGVIATTIFSPARSILPVPAFGTFPLCGGLNRYNCVIDGDTIRYQGTKIRLADVDTPEISAPKCPYEADLGHRAKRRLLELINAGPIEVVSTGGPDVDRYGRKLRLILQNGRSVGDVLVAEGLARRWSRAHRPWCAPKSKGYAARLVHSHSRADFADEAGASHRVDDALSLRSTLRPQDTRRSAVKVFGQARTMLRPAGLACSPRAVFVTSPRLQLLHRNCRIARPG